MKPSFSSFAAKVRSAVLSYGSDVRGIGADSLLAYRNFVHWNLSKLAIFAYAFAAGLIFSIPFLLGIVGIGYYALSNPAGDASRSLFEGKASLPLIQAAILENFGAVTGAVILLLCVVTVFSIFVSYGYFLLSNVHRSYLEGAPLKIRSNLFFAWKKVLRFVAVLGWASLYLLAPALVGIVAFGIAIATMSSGDADPAKNVAMGAVTLAIAVVTALSVAYYAIRTGFSTFVLLADDAGELSGRECVRRSLALTRGKMIRVTLLLLPFVAVVGIADNLLSSLDEKAAVSRMYDTAVRVKSETASGSDDATFLKGYVDRALETEDLRDVVDIINAHAPQASGIDREFFESVAPYLERTALDPRAKRYESLFNALNFLVLDGILSLAYLSLFFRVGGSLRNGSGPVARKEPETDAGSEKAEKTETEKPAAKKKPAAKPSAKSAESDAGTKKKAPAKKPASPKKPAKTKPAE